MCQWFLDRMDTQWLSNKKRFLDKIDMMDASFCTTEPRSLNIPSKYEVYYIPNPVDESFEKLENYKNKNFNNDVFFAILHLSLLSLLYFIIFDDKSLTFL